MGPGFGAASVTQARRGRSGASNRAWEGAATKTPACGLRRVSASLGWAGLKPGLLGGWGSRAASCVARPQPQSQGANPNLENVTRACAFGSRAGWGRGSARVRQHRRGRGGPGRQTARGRARRWKPQGEACGGSSASMGWAGLKPGLLGGCGPRAHPCVAPPQPLSQGADPNLENLTHPPGGVPGSAAGSAGGGLV